MGALIPLDALPLMKMATQVGDCCVWRSRLFKWC